MYQSEIKRFEYEFELRGFHRSLTSFQHSIALSILIIRKKQNRL